jgi:hypothetical protein
MIIILLLFIGWPVSAYFDKKILEFTPGDYVLTPADYYYNKEIVVEAWGGGGAGNACNGYGGGSGGFIRAIVSTGYQNISISVGPGGRGNNPTSYFSCQYNGVYGTYGVDYPKPGTDTVINASCATLVATGGKWNGTMPINSTNGVTGNITIFSDIPSLLSPTQIPDSINRSPTGRDSGCQSCASLIYTCHPGGGLGGGKPCLAQFVDGSVGSWCTTGAYYLGTDGSTPGGGGGGNGYLPPLDANNRPIGYPLCSGCGISRTYGASGGDGKVLVYLNSIIPN